MSALAVALLGLGAICAERGLWAGRRSQARAVVAAPSSDADRRSPAVDLRSIPIPGGVGPDDARLLGPAVDLHRRGGGDLPLVRAQVAGPILERVAAAREVRALTAQARLSGLILGLLPVGFFAFLWLTSRRDIEGALSTPTGLICIALGLLMEGLAFLWIRRLLEIV